MKSLEFSVILFAGFCLATSDVVAEEAADHAQGFELFEKRIRPLLAAECLDCHSGDNAESELQLDSLAGMLEGGQRGPAIVPGKPQESLLMRAVNHGELLKMPPKDKLATRELADLTAWIKMGAPWPNAKTTTTKSAQQQPDGPLFSEEQKAFWAFQTPVVADVPVVQDKAWIQSPIDHFILAKLEAAGLPPAPRATKRHLIRRVTFDLTGLPPTPEDVDEFLADEAADAFARLIDRLLASPAYGERWGRHWLDVARYADSNGMDENLAHAHAFRYRDYVVKSFNDDKPFDRFVVEQLAGDLLTDEEETAQIEALAATGFLVLGPKMLAEDDPLKMQMDIIDEQLDVIGKAFMGMSLGCARCHDHKFDPIPQADYYSLAGIFKSTKTMEHHRVVARWQERPLASQTAIAHSDEIQKQIEQQQSKIKQFQTTANDGLLAEARKHAAEYVLAAEEMRRFQRWLSEWKPGQSSSAVEQQPGSLLIEAETFNRGNVRRDSKNYGTGIGVIVGPGGRNFAEFDVALPQTGAYHLAVRYAAAESRPVQMSINDSVFTLEAAGKVTGGWNPDKQEWHVAGRCRVREKQCQIRLERNGPVPHIDKLLLVPVRDMPTPNKREKLPQSRDSGQANDNTGEPISTAGDSSSQLPDADYELISDFVRQLLADSESQFTLPKRAESFYAPETLAQLKERRTTLESLKASLPSYSQAMAVSDGTIEDARIHFRGNHITQLEVVPRRMLRIIAGENQKPIDHQRSGRLEFARWLTQPNHPLTPRVIVNRVWRWHFGAGLVRTPDLFGSLGERPTHPRLLDWLARSFVDSNWSLKRLHRTIMLSSTYQMSTAFNERANAVDPDNRLWWRMNRRRLEAEAVRDAILDVSDSLDRTMGGTLLPTGNRKYVTSTANVNPNVYEHNRRSVYLPVVRSALFDMFRAFDFADPSVLNGKRVSTTIASQALFMMNSKLVAEQTRQLSASLLANDELSDADRLAELYRRCLSRMPTTDETQRAISYLNHYLDSAAVEDRPQEQQRASAWQSLCRAVLASNEFLYVE